MKHKFWEYPSSYTVLVIWGVSGFGYQPSFSTLILHFVLMPCILLGALYVAHWEGRKEGREEGKPH